MSTKAISTAPLLRALKVSSPVDASTILASGRVVETIAAMTRRTTGEGSAINTLLTGTVSGGFGGLLSLTGFAGEAGERTEMLIARSRKRRGSSVQERAWCKAKTQT